MKLLFDEMYAPAIAEQLRARGHDVASVHDAAYRALEGEPDEDVWAAAVADDRALVSENVQDFRHLEADAIARAQPRAPPIFTTDRQFPRGHPATMGGSRHRARRAARRRTRSGHGTVPEACLIAGPSCRSPTSRLPALQTARCGRSTRRQPDARPTPRVGLRRPWRVGPSVALGPTPGAVARRG